MVLHLHLMAEAERHGRLSLAIIIEQPILDSIEEYAITVACSCSTMTFKQDGYTWRYSNNFNFLREAELMKLLNCNHHLSTSTEAVLNISLSQHQENQLEWASLWIARVFGRRFSDNHFMDCLCLRLYTCGNYRSLMLNCFRERY